jgi:capsular polysaccharide biosynthesis protein
MSHGTADAPDAEGAPPDRPAGAQPPGSARGSAGDFSGRVWAYEDFGTGRESAGTDDLTAEVTEGPTRRRAIRAILRRRALVWCITTVVGLIVGVGLFEVHPVPYQASTSILLSYGSNQNLADASVTDLALAQSRSVAEGALQRLDLRQSVASFQGSYTVTAVTDRVLVMTVSASSSAEAVRRANALAAEFLQFRTALLENQQQLVSAALESQLAQATQQIETMTAQLDKVSAQPVTVARQARTSSLEAQRKQAQATLSGLDQAITSYQANAQVATTATVDGSAVLSAAIPVKRSLRHLVTYPGGGLLAGLALGIGILILVALVSNRPRRRDDVARALGAPVLFSVGSIGLSRRLPGRLGMWAVQGTKAQRIAANLGSAVPPRFRGVAALAVVPVDDAKVAALSTVSLAWSCAQQGLKVVLADLCRGTPAGSLLGVKTPGVREVNVHGVPLVVAVPDPDDVVPIGPLDRRARSDPAAAPLVAACAAADLLLTVTDLDPALGAEHLPGWATDAVVVVTAGRASAAKIRVVGEMIRLADVSLVSGVLVGADKTDESLGVVPEPVADVSMAGAAR